MPSDALIYALTGTVRHHSASTPLAPCVCSARPTLRSKSSYSFTINARDATRTTTQAVTLNVTDVSKPQRHQPDNSSVAENTATASALTIGSLTSADPDAGNTFTYSVVGGADQRFQLSGANLQFQRPGTTLDYETQNNYARHRAAPTRAGWLRQGLDHQPEQRQRKPLISSPAAKRHQGVATALTGISLADPDAGSGLLSLSVSGEPAVFSASNGGGVTVSGAGSPSITLTGSQSQPQCLYCRRPAAATTPAGGRAVPSSRWTAMTMAEWRREAPSGTARH